MGGRLGEAVLVSQPRQVTQGHVGTWKSDIRINEANPLVLGSRGRKSKFPRLPTPTAVKQSPGVGAGGLPEPLQTPARSLG